MIRYKIALIKNNPKTVVWITVVGNNKRMAYEKASQMYYDDFVPIYNSIKELDEEEDFMHINQAS